MEASTQNGCMGSGEITLALGHLGLLFALTFTSSVTSTGPFWAHVFPGQKLEAGMHSPGMKQGGCLRFGDWEVCLGWGAASSSGLTQGWGGEGCWQLLPPVPPAASFRKAGKWWFKKIAPALSSVDELEHLVPPFLLHLQSSSPASLIGFATPPAGTYRGPREGQCNTIFHHGGEGHLLLRGPAQV